MSDERRILIGTSGYSFADWVGPFYPAGTRPSDFLGYYAGHFEVVEVNSTYYRIPHPRVLEQMERKTPPGFRFVVKLNQAMTHQGSRDPGLYREFLSVLDPLKRAGKYDALLAQFPWGFKRTDENRRHLDALRGLLGEEPLFVEFRHDSWLTPQLEPSLRARRIGYCAVDEPQLQGLLPPITMVTTEDAYVRFHGRNARNWWGGSGERQAPSGGGPGFGRAGAPDAARAAGPAELDLAGAGAPARPGDRAATARSGDRYDYDYSEAELREWIVKISGLAEQARRTYLFFNNCHAGQAARNAKLMQELLRQQNLPA
jgi:uncharacterized protein YecE (DUF72 family)